LRRLHPSTARLTTAPRSSLRDHAAGRRAGAAPGAGGRRRPPRPPSARRRATGRPARSGPTPHPCPTRRPLRGTEPPAV